MGTEEFAGPTVLAAVQLEAACTPGCTPSDPNWWAHDSETARMKTCIADCIRSALNAADPAPCMKGVWVQKGGASQYIGQVPCSEAPY